MELNIFNTPLSTIPEVVCRFHEIQSLNLDFNELALLPSDCFTHMRNLTTFSASFNRLTSLQVRALM